MGWTPREVGETGMAEFAAAWRGWRRANVPDAEPSKLPSEADVKNMAKQLELLDG